MLLLRVSSIFIDHALLRFHLLWCFTDPHFILGTAICLVIKCRGVSRSLNSWGTMYVVILLFFVESLLFLIIYLSHKLALELLLVSLGVKATLGAAEGR